MMLLDVLRQGKDMFHGTASQFHGTLRQWWREINTSVDSVVLECFVHDTIINTIVKIVNHGNENPLSNLRGKDVTNRNKTI